MSARAATGQRVLTVRRPLVKPADDAGRLLRAVRGYFVRRVLLLGAVFVVLCMAKVWLRLQVTHVGYDLSAAQEVQLRLLHEQRELEVELATLRDPHRIGELAHKRLGLAEPRSGQVIVLP